MRPCPISCSYLFTEVWAIVTSLYGWCSLELIGTQPAQQYVAALIMEHESQVHVWLVSGHFISHHGLIWILGSSRGVEWEANCMLISLVTQSFRETGSCLDIQPLSGLLQCMQRPHRLLM